MAGKTEGLVARAKRLGEMAYHDMSRAEKEIGPVLTFIDGQLFPGQDIVVRVRRVDQVPAGFKAHVEAHTHNVDEFLIATEGLVFEIMLGDEKRVVEGPATVRIPAGMSHVMHFLRGKGNLIVILRKGDYP